jgi:hypothetical protein
MVSVSISLGALKPCFPAGAFYLRHRFRSIVSNRLGSRCRSKRSPRLAQVQESGGTSREARGGGGLALKRSTMIDAIANRNAATRVTAIRDHIPISSQAVLGAVDYAPLAHGDVSVRPDLLCGNEVVSQCKKHDEDQLRRTVRNLLRWRPAYLPWLQRIALASAQSLKARNHGVVKLKGLQTGECAHTRRLAPELKEVQ